MSAETIEQGPIDVEEIMQQIRREILTRQAVAGKDGRPLVSVSGSQLPPEFYEHLYYAAMQHDQIGVKLQVTKMNLPLLGPLLEKMRGKVHELVLFYVNQIAVQQVEFNKHILQAVNLMAEAAEDQANSTS